MLSFSDTLDHTHSPFTQKPPVVQTLPKRRLALPDLSCHRLRDCARRFCLASRLVPALCWRSGLRRLVDSSKIEDGVLSIEAFKQAYVSLGILLCHYNTKTVWLIILRGPVSPRNAPRNRGGIPYESRSWNEPVRT